MSVYPPPSNDSSIFNPSSFTSGETPLTTVDGDNRYLKLTGSIAPGLQTLNGGLNCDLITTSQLETKSSTLTLTTNSNSNSIIETYICPRSNSVRQAGDSAAVVLAGSGYGLTGYEGTKMELSHDTLITNKIGATNILSVSGSAITTAAEIVTAHPVALTLTNNLGQIRIGNLSASQGSNGLPSIAFSGATNTFNTGIYASAAGTLSMTCNGSQRFQLNSSSLSTMGTFRAQATGTVTAPAVQITDTNNGFYKINTAQIGLTTNGTLRCDWDATRMLLAGALYVPNGSVAAPSITFGGDTNTGLYSVGGDIIGITCGGINGGSFTSSGPTFSGAVTANRIQFSAAGTTTVPALSFSSDTNTGLYNPAAFTVGIVSGGNESARFTSSGATIKNSVIVDRLQVGSASNQTLYWSAWGTTVTIASVPAGSSGTISISYGTTAPLSTIVVTASVINASNPDRIAYGCSNITTTGFDLFYINNYGFTVTSLKLGWIARV